MATGADLKGKLIGFVKEQQDALDRLEASYLAERTRIETQIANADAVLNKWDKNLEGVIDTLALAGITVKTNG